MKYVPMVKKLTYVLIFFLFFDQASAQQSSWKEIYPGVWKLTVGNPEAISLLKAAGTEPNVEAIKKLPRTIFPLNQEDISTEVVDGKTYLRFPLDRGEAIYGLGLNFKTHNQRGRILDLHVDHYGGRDDGRTHAPVPFYVSSNGYGVLVDVARYITTYVGTGVRTDTKNPPVLRDRNTDKQWEALPYSDGIEMMASAKGLDIYVFEGPTPLKAVQRFNLFNGGGYLPPKWGLGFTQRVPTLYSDQDILKEVKEFEDHDFPLDFIGVEPGWHSMAYPCTFEWDQGRFPDPKGFIETLDEKGVKANLWMNPYVSPIGSLYPKVKPLSGTHTVWNGIVPDFTLPEVQSIFKEHFNTHHLDIGVSGYKIDEVDGFDRWLWPDVAKFPSGLSGEQMRQIYGLLVQKLTADWFKEKNQRTYGLVRASNAGGSTFPYVIYNDYYSHKDFITALINSGFIGMLWTPEVRSSGNAEDWLRRMQSVCFSPMAMLNAWADGTKPWSFPEVEDQVREVSYLRMQLLPYIYTAFAHYAFEGIPPFRPMQLEEGFYNIEEKEDGKLDATANPYAMAQLKEIKYQYMMGEYLLVAPMFAGETTRKVVLPPGKWYDFYTGELAGEGEVIEIEPGLDKIPLFVKDGGIIPMIPKRRQAPGKEEKLPLEIRHYGGKEATYNLYDDDGTSFDFEQGAHSWTSFKIVKHPKKGLQGTMSKPQKNKPFSYDRKVTWKFMTNSN
ncbi:glycoside hydrolase family 31 protein [Fulvivirgaceae bacterium BMA10]|uniref:Glycoside hydrolase family 31 protein n=1 Tax=Splendidivirga corallicola TaxID=3051826 RepID=A0ABT8KRK7_9BACT|nr:glycoside hydrolase family 31 protein [Fulvivirgaceae bacterium BMA10]